MIENLKKLFVFVFLGLLILPNFVLLLGLEKNLMNNENRVFKSLPKFQVNSPLKSIGDFRTYYEENFGAKTFLVNNYIKAKNALGENPIPNRVIKGKNDFYFLGNQFNNVLNNSFGNDPINQQELDIIVKNIKAVKSYLNSKNIPFYIVIPPDKHNVYKEYLPFELTQRDTKLKRIKQYVEKEISLSIIDLTDILIKNKKNKELYIKSDSHWNDYGAFIGYKETLKIINKDHSFFELNLNDFNILDTLIDTGSNTKMINYFPEVNNIVLKKKGALDYKITKLKNKDWFIFNPAQKNKVIFYGDSFSNNLIDFFGESFNESFFLRGYTISKSFIDKEKPDLVIFEIIERNIDAVLGKKKPLIQ